MRVVLLLCMTMFSLQLFSQREADSTYSRCPVALTDTTTGNNYFIEHLPASVKTYRNHGNFTVVIEQKNQFLTIFFHARKLSTKGKYSIGVGETGRNEVTAKYSFRSGESVAYLDVSSGKVETSYDKSTKLWHIKLTGLVANMGDTKVTYFKMKADLFLR
ncbi:MAG TPA: hypothetical protein VN451_04295 [Chitinophagaceae bacterium]|nr:hypothetical protein [Chitinophagaceae bacterium]